MRPAHPSTARVTCLGLGLVLLAVGCEWTPQDPLNLPSTEAPTLLVDGLLDPRDLASMSDGLAVAERGAGRVVLIDQDGNVTSLLDELSAPQFLASEDDSLVVSDPEGEEVWLVAGDGETSLLGDQGSPGRVEFEEGLIAWTAEVEDQGASLHWALPDGSDSGVLAEGLDDPGGLAITLDAVYLAERGSGASLLRIDRNTGEVSSIASPFEAPQDVITWNGELLFTARSPTWPGGGWIYRVGLAGEALEELSYSPPQLNRLAAGGETAWWGARESINRVGTGGGTYEVAAAQTRVGDLLLDSERLVWTDHDRGELLELPTE